MTNAISTVDQKKKEVNLLIDSAKKKTSQILLLLSEELRQADLYISDLIHFVEDLENTDDMTVDSLSPELKDAMVGLLLDIQKATRRRRSIKDELSEAEQNLNEFEKRSSKSLKKDPEYRIRTESGVESLNKVLSNNVGMKIPMIIPNKLKKIEKTENTVSPVLITQLATASADLLNSKPNPKLKQNIQKIMFLLDVDSSRANKLYLLRSEFVIKNNGAIVFSSNSLEDAFSYILETDSYTFMDSNIVELVYDAMSELLLNKFNLGKLHLELSRIDNNYVLTKGDEIIFLHQKLSYILKKIKRLPVVMNYRSELSSVIRSSIHKYPSLEVQPLEMNLQSSLC